MVGLLTFGKSRIHLRNCQFNLLRTSRRQIGSGNFAVPEISQEDAPQAQEPGQIQKNRCISSYKAVEAGWAGSCRP